jgi:hypothetical protein
MWQCDPKILCTQHLLGEHGEIHKHRWTFEKKHKKDRYIINNCIEPKDMKNRHDLLAEELKNRGMNHKSPFEMPDISYLPEAQREYTIDRAAALKELFARCEKCRNNHVK